MPAFEPSTWAEVEEALASWKSSAHSTNSFVAKVRAFTDAPERFTFRPQATPQPALSSISAPDVASSDGEEPHPTTAQTQDAGRKPARIPLSNVKRSDGQFDDLLGMGRVDVEAETFVRKYVTNPNMDEINVTPVSAIGRKVSQSPINPSSKSFDANAYLARVHKMSSLEELSRGREALTELKKRFRAEAEQIRKQEYVGAALVEAAFQKAKQSIRLSSSKGASGRPSEAATAFSRAEALLRERYSEVIRREATLTRLRRTLGVYTRYQWIFALGQRLRAAAAEGPNETEDAIREYHRGMKWVEAQEDEGLSSIEADISDGFDFLVDSIFMQLSTKDQSHQQTSRLVAILTSIKRDDLLTEALSTRMHHATNELRKLNRINDVPSETQFATERIQREAVGLMTRANAAFIDGLAHMWQLGRILRKQEKWLAVTDENIALCCEAYCAIAREVLLDGSTSLSRETVRELGLVLTKAKDDLQIPTAALKPLTEVTREISEQFLRAICTSVTHKAERLVAQAVQTHSKIGSDAARRLSTILTEALDEVQESLVHQHEIFDDSEKKQMESVEKISTEGMEPPLETSEGGISGVTRVGITCARVPGELADKLYDLLREEDFDNETLPLRLAVCSVELTNSAIEAVVRRTGPSSAFDTNVVSRVIHESEAKVRRTLTRATTIYVTLVSKPLQSFVAGLISFPQEEQEESVSRTIPIKIEGISKGANEVTLQLALITISIRQTSQNSKLIRAILLSLIQDIGNTLVDVLSTDKLIYHRAAQLWVDVTYIQDTITRGADVETLGLQKALDGYSRVKERAVQAVRADGYSFSLTDMSVLRETVIAGGMKQAQMVHDCFRETWALVGGERTTEGS